VAGWCLVKDVLERRVRWRKTEEIYNDKNLCNLVRDTTVTGRATPVPATRYFGNVKNLPKPTGTCVKDVLPLCPPKPKKT
ncbi:MAG: hypothetical protein R2724_35300, partial [Bryobacterales bacterium]